MTCVPAVFTVSHHGPSPYAPTVPSVVVFVPLLRIEAAHPAERARYRHNGRVEG
jgi:hypothetical protein